MLPFASRRDVALLLVLLLTAATAPSASAQQVERGLVRYGNLVVRQSDLVAVVLRDGRPKSFTLELYCRQSTGDITIIQVPPDNADSGTLLWRAFASLPTPQQQQHGLIKCGDLLVVRVDAITAVQRIDLPDRPGTVARLALQLDTKPMEITFLEKVISREQIASTWDAIAALTTYQ